jgi:hypothetical protein
MGIEETLPGGLSGRGVKLTTHLHLVPRSRKVEPYLHSPTRLHGIVLNPSKTESLYITYKNSVRTSQETHHVSTTKPSRLMLFGETVAVYCENHTEHTDTLCGQNVEFVPHRKHITSPLQSPTG